MDIKEVLSKHDKLPIIIATIIVIYSILECLQYASFSSGDRLVIYVSTRVLFIALALLAFIPATIAKRKGYSETGYYFFGLFFFLPALVVALLIHDKGEGTPKQPNEGSVPVKYHVVIKKETVSDGVYRELWTCPDCGQSWYISDINATTAKCGNNRCECSVALNRQ